MTTLVLANLAGWAIAHWKTALALALIALLIVVVGLWWACSPSRLEKRIEERSPVIVEHQQAANAANAMATNANANAADAADDARRAQENVNKIQRDRRANVSLDEANRNRCRAFPQSEGC